MSTKENLISAGLLAAGGVAIAAASGVYSKGSRNEDSRFREILKDKPELPEGEILNARCNIGGHEWYARIRGKGWFYLLRGAWVACPMGPPGASYPHDFVDPPRPKGSRATPGPTQPGKSRLRDLRIALADTSASFYARHPDPAPWEKPRKHEPAPKYVTFHYRTHYSYGAGVFAYRENGYGQLPPGHVASSHKDPMRAQFEAVRALVDEDIELVAGVFWGDWVVLDVQALPCPLGEQATLRWAVRLALRPSLDEARPSKGSRATTWEPKGDDFRRADVTYPDEVEVLYVSELRMYLPYVKCAGHVLSFDAALPLARAKIEASQAYDVQRNHNDYVGRNPYPKSSRSKP